MAEMKCEITVENWDEDYMHESVTQKLADRLMANIAPDTDKLRRELDAMIRSKIGPMVDEALAKPFQKTNSYGEPTGQSISMTEAIMRQAQEFLMRKVDYQGRDTNSYDCKTTRLDYIVGCVLQDALKTIKEQVTTAANEAIKRSARTEIEQCLKKILGIEA